MSGRGGRGGRGGARGGRGGARGGRAPPGIPGWDPETNMLVNDQPQDTYPKTYQPPVAPPLSAADARSVASLVAFRRAFHNLPLYTHRHMAAEVISSAAVTDPPPRLYDQSQVNARFGVKSKATLDPFLAVPMYSHQFVDEARILPDLRSRSFAKHLFPDELWNTLDGKDRISASAKSAKLNGRAPSKRKLDHADPDDPFSAWDDDPLSGANRGANGKKHENETEEQRQRRIREAAEGGGPGAGDNEEGDGDVDVDDDEAEMSQEDDDFEDDEDGGDYDAEQYFDDGVDGDMEDEGVGESALDF